MSIAKKDIQIESNATFYTWSKAVENIIILDYVYTWNRTTQSSELAEILLPGYGYWIYAYSPCTFYYNKVQNSHYNRCITTIDIQWNLINTPYEFSVNKTNLSVWYDNQWYTWDSVVTAEILLPFIYQWEEQSQSYYSENRFLPGKGAWIYAQSPCKLFYLRV